MPRFVILEHDHPVLHWDLMLEAGPVLRTWRLAGEPAPGRAVPAEPIGDHRKLYLDYEGPVSGGRGSVRRWDAGEYDAGPAGAARPDGGLVVALRGGRLRGRASLGRDAGGRWSFFFDEA
jgi:hypothetical protein